MKKLILQIIVLVLLLTPAALRSQSNIQIQSGASSEVQAGADVCADTRTIQGILTGAGTWCLIPLTPGAPQLSSPSYNATGQLLTLNLIWQKSFGAVTYRVQLSTDSLFSTTIVNDSTVTDSIRTVSGLSPLTYYWWRVNAKGIGGTSVYSAVYKFKTLGYPNLVTLINPANNAVNQPLSIQFRWTKATEQLNPFAGSDAQELSKKENPKISEDPAVNLEAIGNYWFELVTDTVSLANLTRDTTLTDTTKLVSSLSNLTNYFWKVKAKNQIGWGQFSVWWRFTTILAAPAPPLLVSPPNNSVGQNLSLTLVWNKSSSASSYRIQVATDSLFAGLIVNDSTLTDSTRVISGLNPLTNYWWRVNAKNIGGTSTYSAVYKFRTLGNPNQVTLINPPNNALNQPLSIQFRWTKATEQTNPFAGSDAQVLSQKEKPKVSVDPVVNLEAIGNYWFDLVTDTVSLANLTRDTTLTDTTKSVSSLTNSTNYYWRVKAKNQIGWGQFSAWWRFTTILAAPAPPLLVSPPNNSVGQNLSLTLVWNKSSSASSYRIQLSTDSLFSVLIVNDSTLIDSIKAVSGLNPLTNYWWRVNAKNIGGTSTYSAVYKFRTLGNPNQVTLINPPNNAVNQPLSIQFRWSRASEQTNPFGGPDVQELSEKEKSKVSEDPEVNLETIGNYWFELVTDTVSQANLTRDTTLTDTTKLVSSLSNLTNYYWRVKAKNQIGWGQFSAWWRFTTIVAAPLAPILVSPPNGATGQLLSLTLVWRKSVNAASYRLQVATDAGFNNLIVNDSTLTDSLKLVSGLSQLTTYYWRVNAKNAGGTSAFSTVWNFTTQALFPNLTLKVYLEGFYSPEPGDNNKNTKNGTRLEPLAQVADTVKIYLADSLQNYAFKDSVKVILSSSGTVTTPFTNATTGKYYIVVRHRNHLETWSKYGVSFTGGSTTSYDFTTGAGKAYGDNMKQLGSVWVIYGGDPNQDGDIGALDIPIFISQFGTQGYLSCDFNGDDDVTGVDQQILILNYGITVAKPGTIMQNPANKTGIKEFQGKNSEIKNNNYK